MISDVEVKQFELAERDSLLAFLQIAYANEPVKFDPAYWNWHYLENPYTAPNNIPLWVVKDRDRVVGQAATILVKLKVGDEMRFAVWILDFVLLPEYRGRKLGKRLLLLARETYPTMLALGYNQMSGNVLSSLGWLPMGTIHRYQRLLFPGFAAKELARIALVRGLVNFGYAPFRPRLNVKSESIRRVDVIDSAFDDLWSRACTQWPCAVVRGSAFLNWQFRRQPGKVFEMIGYFDGDQLRGYLVLFFRRGEYGAPPKVAITDICYHPENADRVIASLLETALASATERRAGSIVIDVLDSRVESHLQRHGFWRIKRAPPFMIYSPTKQDLIYQAANWYLTRADSDVSIFEGPNVE